MKLKDKIALVTGGNRGIGRETCLLYVKEGAKVALTARNADQLSVVVEEIRKGGGEAIGLAGDVANPEDVQRIVADTVNEFGGIDILVNNAGIMQGGPLAVYAPEDWRRVIDVNLMGTYYYTRAVVPMLLERGWGRVINVSSRGGKLGIPYLTAYVASKHGVVGFTKALAEELASFNITVNAICPGTVETDMVPDTTKAEKAQIGEPLIPPEHVADLALYLATDAAGSVNGEAINIYGRTKLDFSKMHGNI